MSTTHLPIERRLFISQASGWSDFRQIGDRLFGVPPGHVPLNECDKFRLVPDYDVDLDACHAAENLMKESLGDAYAITLRMVIRERYRKVNKPHSSVPAWRNYSATASERTEAICRHLQPNPQ